jgi:hypothetical protein
MSRDWDALAEAIGRGLPLRSGWRRRALTVFLVTTRPLVLAMLRTQRWLYEHNCADFAWPVEALNRRFIMAIWAWLHGPELARSERERLDRLRSLTGGAS